MLLALSIEALASAFCAAVKLLFELMAFLALALAVSRAWLLEVEVVAFELLVVAVEVLVDDAVEPATLLVFFELDVLLVDEFLLLVLSDEEPLFDEFTADEELELVFSPVDVPEVLVYMSGVN